ncbi:tumor susceptibility gene 101 protein [Hypomesus transpacificus]|uniref:tumor susceptibility gene 101 protein n=1 Tax=Hypomesus transpacificus TaxID=137520 RepID=UPI001F07251C|nr:tumor susceptibility gene 101 protein [Hypomesus transpacificus]
MGNDNLDALRKMIPKTYNHRKHVALEIWVVLSQCKGLQAMMDKYVFNDGSVRDLMSLTGTIPVTFNGQKYNIPVQLWLEESYPGSAPMCYVKPTQEMMIVRSRHINSNGEVLLPYLEEWKHTECDLFSLVQVMSAIFGEIPPLCIRPGVEPDQATCSQQSQRYTGASSDAGTSSISLISEDDPPFQEDNETNC